MAYSGRDQPKNLHSRDTDIGQLDQHRHKQLRGYDDAKGNDVAAFALSEMSPIQMPELSGIQSEVGDIGDLQQRGEDGETIAAGAGGQEEGGNGEGAETAEMQQPAGPPLTHTVENGMMQLQQRRQDLEKKASM